MLLVGFCASVALTVPLGMMSEGGTQCAHRAELAGGLVAIPNSHSYVRVNVDADADLDVGLRYFFLRSLRSHR